VSEVIMSVVMKIVFWDMLLYSVVKVY